VNGQSRTRSIVLCGLSIALLTVGAFVTIPVPVGLAPFTMQTMMLFIILLILKPTEAIIAVAGYLVLGAIGLPIFAGMTGGFAKLIGPTGGFLFGYLLAVLLIGGVRLLVARKHRKPQVSQTTLDEQEPVEAKSHPLPESQNHHEAPTPQKPQSLKARIVFDLALILSTCVIYFSLGTVWYSINMGVGLSAAAAACVLPFVVTEPLKIVAAIMCAQPVRIALGLNHNQSGQS